MEMKNFKKLLFGTFYSDNKLHSICHFPDLNFLEKSLIQFDDTLSESLWWRTTKRSIIVSLYVCQPIGPFSRLEIYSTNISFNNSTTRV